MGKIKGQLQYGKWQRGERLTRKGAVLAHCFVCNGFEQGAEDCLGSQNCPLYEYFSYKGVKGQKIEEDTK